MKNIVLDLPGFQLWEGPAPLAAGNEKEDCPVLSPFIPEGEHSQAAVIVCPGGAYLGLANDHEGKQVAEWLNTLGIYAFVLRYRLGPVYHHPAQLMDIQRAIRTVRARAAEWNIDPRKIGAWGFSAGGHLAATAGTHFDGGDPNASDPIERASSRPDFLILAYPVITMTESFGHSVCRETLLGENPSPELVESLSNEKQVTKDTPPTFIFTTDDDEGVPPENSASFYIALSRAGVPAELHIYAHGRHGLGLAPGDPILKTWPDRLRDWLMGIMKQK